MHYGQKHPNNFMDVIYVLGPRRPSIKGLITPQSIPRMRSLIRPTKGRVKKMKEGPLAWHYSSRSITNFPYSKRLTAQRASENQECLPAFLEHVVLRILRSKDKLHFTSSCEVQTAIKLPEKNPVHRRAPTKVQGSMWIHFSLPSLCKTIPSNAT